MTVAPELSREASADKMHAIATRAFATRPELAALERAVEELEEEAENNRAVANNLVRHWHDMQSDLSRRWAYGLEGRMLLYREVKRFDEISNSDVLLGKQAEKDIKKKRKRARQRNDTQTQAECERALELVRRGRKAIAVWQGAYRRAYAELDRDLRRLELRLRTGNQRRIAPSNPPSPDHGIAFDAAKDMVRENTIKSRAYLVD